MLNEQAITELVELRFTMEHNPRNEDIDIDIQRAKEDEGHYNIFAKVSFRSDTSIQFDVNIDTTEPLYPQEYALLTSHGVDFCALYGYSNPTSKNEQQQQWLSPVQSEREFQEHMLKAIFPSYPSGALPWQYMNALLVNVSVLIKHNALKK